MLKIIVTDRGSDYHACLEGRPGIWSSGRTSYEAIGNLLTAHTDAFKIEITLPPVRVMR